MTFKEWLIENKPDVNVEEYIQLECPPSNLGHIEPDYCIGENPTCCSWCWDRKITKILPTRYPIDTAAEAELAKGDADKWTKENPSLSDSAKKAIGEHRIHILDSGDRTEFATGAVRDMREGKGRCDLMPLEVVYKYFELVNAQDKVLWWISSFQKNGLSLDLYNAIESFCTICWACDPATMFLEVAKHFEEGAKKYGENNWQKGIPVHCYIDSAVRHYLKWLRGDKDEPHDRAFVWNLMCCIWEVDYREKESADA